MRHTTTAITVISKIGDRPVSKSAALVVIHGDELGRKYDLDKPKFIIGRSSRCDVQVDQDAVSRQHAKLTLSDTGRVTVEDLGSTNGTYVNDDQTDGELRLRNGDLIKIGRTIFKFIASNNIEAAYHDEVYRLTTTDGLTQVFNRRFFEEALERELSRCRRYGRALSLVMIDIDHFKHINDRYGHLAGDAVLKDVAMVVRSRIRREDVLARWGGEEFALLLPEVDLQGAVAMAEKVRRLIEKHIFTFDEVDIPVTLSAGVAALGKRQLSPEALVKGADEKLYEAKQSGRNKVCV
jgi:diguanylate cyclase (GGDEF)-like protein